MSLVLICADLALQGSLTSVTHTSHSGRTESVMEWRMVEMAREKLNVAHHSARLDFGNAVRLSLSEAKITGRCLNSATFLISQK